MDDRLMTGKTYRRRTRHPGLLSLSYPSVGRHYEYPAKAGKANRRSRHTLARIRGLAVLAGVCLNTITADVREAIAH